MFCRAHSPHESLLETDSKVRVLIVNKVLEALEEYINNLISSQSLTETDF